MDDFLHNLRSGNLKQSDRSRRQYGDPQYKGPQRRTGAERRKRDLENGLQTGTLATIKDLLRNIHENQKRMVKAIDERNKTEDRKAKALEQIVERLDKISFEKKSNTAKTNLQMVKRDDGEMKKSAPVVLQAKVPKKNDGTGSMICQLRSKGFSYAKIADILEAEGIPTVSGKGRWRGQSVQRLYLKVQPEY
jgi:vacuolar-type H+-ATPase subunit I/STV1